MSIPTPTDTPELQLEVADPRTPEAAVLLDLLTAELARRYNDDGAGDFKVEDVFQPRSVFLLGRLRDRAVACGALRFREETVAEVKRMYVEPDARGRGFARRILVELEAHAQRLSYRTVRLETGVEQPEAMRLYESAGYHRIDNYGHYRDDPRSVCYEKTLADAASLSCSQPVAPAPG